MTRKPLKIAATIAVVVIAFTGLMFATLREDTQYYKRVDEVMSDPAAWQGKRLQLHGYASAIEKKRNSLDYRFKVEHNGRVVTAYYKGVVPDTFKEGSEVVLKGKLSTEGFQVERGGVIGKCPSKYEPQKAAAPPTTGS
jgi:cytochrome c-type biogenesis protein CcmE